MKIDEKILSIPPFISTSWKNIQTLSADYQNNQSILLIELKNGRIISIPNLKGEEITEIFDFHEKTLHKEETSKKNQPSPFLPPPGLGIPLKIGPEGIENMGSMMQHNPSQSNAPDLPPEILEKIAQIVKVIGPVDPQELPKPEPHCNCMHCQFAKAIQKAMGATDISDNTIEEEVSDEDLKFRDWNVEEIDDKLYKVSNPLDPNEEYKVFLGTPLGCTCGKKNCEHIKAVLDT
ncbi:MAG TPA: hypothetical protein P5048_00575 [Chlamydiales bacterium]|nr:hypothetical protein [Chlamydiales bacterium]